LIAGEPSAPPIPTAEVVASADDQGLASAVPGAVAQVYVDIGLPHLDRPFDYSIPSDLSDEVDVGVRVKVRFSGRVVDGWVVGRSAATDDRALAPLRRLVSPEPVLPPSSVRLLRAVADHCGGTFCDVARLAVPPRHATTEKAPHHRAEDIAPVDLGASAIDEYAAGPTYRAALATGGHPRAVWTVTPVAGAQGDWADGLAGAAASTLASGRSAVLIVPDAKDCDRLLAAVHARIDPRLVVRQSADLGPAARYRGFLKSLRGEARVVVGTRAAAYTPVADLGLIALWDDGDDLYADPRAPYPHTRDVVALRGAQAQAATLFAATARSTPIQAWVESGWLGVIEQPTRVRRLRAPRTLIAGQNPRAEANAAPAASARLPHDVFTVVRAALAEGPVLVQVPHAGYRRHLRCARCGEALRCSCGGPLSEPVDTRDHALTCGWCGRVTASWVCPTCDGRRFRASVIGTARTAEELALAFSEAPVVRSDRDHQPPAVDDTPTLVVATPGAEPPAAAGYAAAVLLDADYLLNRAGLEAGEEALRRWLQVTALVRPAAEGGTAILVGPPGDRAVQAWLRLDPAGYATRELADRRAAGLPPGVRMALVRGEAAAVDAVVADVPLWVDRLGPVPDPTEPGVLHVLLRGPTSRGRDLAHLVHELAAARSAAKAPGAVSFRLDPVDLG
jgi:primosomal protein N' (replication factor Y)